MTNTIHVQLRGRFVKDDLFSLKVLSVHKGIINLLNKNSALIISLIEDKKNMTAMSLLVPDLFLMLGNTPEIILNNQWKIIDTIEINGFTTDYSNAPIWVETRSPIPLSITDRLKELEILAAKIDPGESFFSLFTEGSRNIYQLKVHSLLQRTISIENHSVSGLENLVGLGQGLTPSGDDFITGALLGEISSNRAFRINRDQISNRLDRTTYAGKTLLHLALNESYPAYLLTFLEELHQSEGVGDLLKAFLKATQHGSTSGMDSLAGFYWYYKFSSSKI